MSDPRCPKCGTVMKQAPPDYDPDIGEINAFWWCPKGCLQDTMKIETVKLIQKEADKTLLKEEWVVIDGVDNPGPKGVE